MEATVVSVGKSVLDGALGYAKSVVAEEVALQLGVQRDHAFIRDELEMMLAFLKAAHEEHDDNKVVKAWVKQVRDVAYDVEDSLHDFAVRLANPSWWRIFRTMLDRRRVAKQIKELRTKVEDVSHRNVRYRLIKGADTKLDTVTRQSSVTAETMSGFEEAIRQRGKAKVDLIRLIHNKDKNLRVIAVWGTSGVLLETSFIKAAYDDLKRSKNFECHAMIKIMRPFKPTEFLQNIVRQFYINSLEGAATQQVSTLGVQDLRRMGMTNNQRDLVDAFKKYVEEKSYLIVLTDLSTIEEWDQIKALFPRNRKGSRLIVCAEQVEVASLCVGPGTVQPEHKQLSSNQAQALYVFYEKVSQGGTEITEESEEDPSSSNATVIVDSRDEKRLTRMETILLTAFRESQLIGRENEKLEIIKMISNRHSQEFDVISICGMGGIGKTSLVKYVYQSQELNPMFEKRACVTIKRPFNPKELLDSLATQLSHKEGVVTGDTLAAFLQGKRYLIVLDDVSSTTEWDAVEQNFPRTDTMSRIIVTTREENIAKHCSKERRNICKLNFLTEKDAHDLFMEKVFGSIYLAEQYPELAEEAKLVLKKCKGLPLAIVTIGGFLAKQPKTRMEWRKLNEHIGAEMEMNPELEMIKNILIKSYDGLPYHLKSCFLYLSIFPEDYNICRRRLVHRWIAEGYPSEVPVKSMTEKAEVYFMELIERGMILASQQSVLSRKKVDYCKVHDLMREISISKSTKDNLVLRIEEGCNLNTYGRVRHLTINSNWKRDQSEFDSIEDLSHIRSLTVFGKWMPFFISDKMCFLRVLDLENTESLLDHHLQQIGNLLHLKYLSLRGCKGIHHLPDSIGNLKQLLTLDTRNTSIIKLPKNIVNLRKLQYIHAGNRRTTESYDEIASSVPEFMQNKPCLLALVSVLFCAAYCAPHVMEEDGLSRRDVCNAFCCFMFPVIMRELNAACGVVLPRGFRKLRALHTLSVVNIAGGKGILLEIKRLTQLRRLAVSGINKKNSQEVLSTLAGLTCLESLSLYAKGGLGLHDCLNRVPPPHEKLQSLTLSGALLKLPEWLKGLHNLMKLKLEGTQLTDLDETKLIIGKQLPNLAILGLLQDSLLRGTEHRLTFRPEEFKNLMVLQLSSIRNLISVEFEKGATPMFEVLRFDDSLCSISGLSSLRSLKEVQIEDHGYIHLMTDVRTQLSKNPNKPVLKTIVN